MNKKNCLGWIDSIKISYPNFSKCTILTFDDSKRGRKELVGTYSQDNINWEKIMSDNDKGAGVFFTINQMEPGHTDKAGVVGVNAWACEIDGMDKETQRELISLSPIKPSMIIESKNSYHMYWFAKEGTKENWSKICWGLRNFFNGDKAIAGDISRVLRMPGFNHMKNPEDPFLCEVIDFSGVYYTEEEMFKAYPDTETYQDKQNKLRKREIDFTNESGEDFWNRVRAMDSKTMLERVSGTKFVSYENITFKKNSGGTEQIYVNGKSTGCWIDREGKIGSTDKGGPNRTNWVFRYGLTDGKELYQWIIKEFPSMKPDKILQPKKNTSVKVIENNITLDGEGITPFTWGIKELDERFGKIDYHNLVCAMGESGSGKTEFTFFQARQNAKAGIKTCYIGLEMSKSDMINRIAMKRSGVSKSQRDNKQMTDQQKCRMKVIHDEIWNWDNLEIVSLENPTCKGICEYITEKNKEGYELFFIDNLGFIVGEDGQTELDITKETGRELKILTNKLKLSIILLHHYNKGVSGSRQKPRELSDIRSSGKIENDSDLIFQIWRDFSEEDERFSSQVQFLLQKDRKRGTPGTMNIKFVAGDYETREDPF